MSATGINYFLDYLGLDTTNLAVFYTFTGVASNNLPSVSYGKAAYSGQISGSVFDFTGVPNSGHFVSGNYVKISNVTATGLSGDATLMLVYEKPTTGGGVIFSSLTGTTFSSGYILGINDANRLYFEYRDNEGPVVVTSNKIYGQKNAVGVNISLNSVSFNYYDVNLKKLESENFTINSNYLLFSDQWYLGRTFSNYLSPLPFTGYLDHFIYFNQTVSRNNMERLFSGIFSLPTTIPAVSGAVVTTGITSYQLTFTGQTGINSFSDTFSGFSSLNTGYDCGTYPVFSTGALSGYLSSGYAVSPVTGLITGYNLITPATTGLVINSGYLSGFGMDFVSYMWDRSGTPQDATEIVVLTGVYNTSWLKQSSTYDNVVQEFATNSLYQSGNLNVSLNGVYQVESGFISGGQYYNFAVSGLADFYILGDQFLYTNFFVSGVDVEFFDSAQQQNRGILLSTYDVSRALNSVGVSPGVFLGKDVFLNGQKLLSGVDYQVSGTTVFSGSTGITGITGHLTFVNKYTGWNLTTGTYDRYTTGSKFSRNTSVYYLNGIRIDPSIYVEHSIVDLISGKNIYDITVQNMDNNNESLNYWF